MIPRQVQIQYLAECATQEELSPIDLDNFTEPWRTCYQIMSDCNPADAMHELVQRLMVMPWSEDWPSKEGVIQEIDRATRSPLQFPSLGDLSATLEPITWLWPNWIPRGMLSLLGAVPGAGKSYLSLDLARRIIDPTETFPDGEPTPRPGSRVIYVDAEAVPQITNERAAAWEMDTRKLFLMLPDQYSYIDLTTEQHQERLVTMAHVIRPEMVIVDSLSSISTRGENNVEDVRAILSFLAQLASTYDCGLVLIHHLRKRSSTAFLNVLSIDDFRGSSHIIAMARSVLGLSIIQTGPDQDRNGPRQLEIIKTNLACYPRALGVSFDPLHPKGVILNYGDPPMAYKEPTQVDLCATWLLETLEEYGEPLARRELVALAEEEGYSESTVYRARKACGDAVAYTGGFRDPTNRWGTPETVARWEEHRQAEAAEVEERGPTDTERCRDWLLDLMDQAGGPVATKEIIQRAADAGYSRGAVYRARDLLNGQVVAIKRGVWELQPA